MSTVRAAESGFPESIDSARASFSRSRSIRRASRRSSFDLSTTGVTDQVGKAWSAAATERSTSRASELATSAYVSPVAGSPSSSHSPQEAGACRPSMKFRTSCIRPSFTAFSRPALLQVGAHRRGPGLPDRSLELVECHARCGAAFEPQQRQRGLASAVGRNLDPQLHAGVLDRPRALFRRRSRQRALRFADVREMAPLRGSDLRGGGLKERVERRSGERLGDERDGRASGAQLLDRDLGHEIAGVGLESLGRSEEHTSELQSLAYLVCRLLLEKKKELI